MTEVMADPRPEKLRELFNSMMDADSAYGKAHREADKKKEAWEGLRNEFAVLAKDLGKGEFYVDHVGSIYRIVVAGDLSFDLERVESL